jgi:hypothetical protein
MTTAITPSEKDDLELMIDRIGLTAFANVLADICYEKAEHVSVNWQDKNLARIWRKASTSAQKLAAIGVEL